MRLTDRVSFFACMLHEQPGAPSGGSPAPAAPAAPAAPVAPAVPGSAPSPTAPGLLKHADPAAPAAPVPADGQPYRPQGLAEAFHGKDDRETIDRLMRGVRTAPAKADDYKLDLPKDVAAALGDMKDDKVLPMFRSVGLKHGLDQAQFNGVIGDLFGEMQKAGMLQPPIDDHAEFAKLAGNETDPVRRAAVVRERVNGVTTFLSGLETRGVLTKAEAEVMRAGASVFEGVTALEKIMKAMQPGGIQGGGVSAPGVGTRAQLEAEMKDERYDSRSPKYDRAFRARVDADLQKHFSAGVR